MYLTFQDYSKLNEWCEAYKKYDNAIVDFTVKTSSNRTVVTATFVKSKERYYMRVELWFGECNPFEVYNYNKFKEDMELLIGQEIMKSEIG